MRDKEKSKEQLIEELKELRQKLTKLKKSESERNNVKKESRKSEDHYKNIIEFLTDGYLRVNLRGIITECNSAFLNHTGYSREDIVNKHFTKLPTVRLKDIPRYIKMYNSARRGKFPKPIEYKWIHKDGTTRWGESYFGIIKKRNRISGLSIITRDITERKWAEVALRESEGKYRSLVESTSDSVFMVDRDCRYTFMNKKNLSRFGLPKDKVIGKAYSEFHSEKSSEMFTKRVNEVLKTNKSKTFEYRSQRDGRYFLRTLSPIKESDGKINGVIVISKDITERKRAEDEKEMLWAQLIHSEKMAGIGTLTAGIAHEFNNILQIMRGHAEFASRTEKPEEMKEALDLVKKTSDRASKIIRDLLSFSSDEISEKELCDITVPLETVFSLIENHIRKHNIEIVRKYEKVPKIEMNKAEIQQVFLNMVTNARDAMFPEGGKLEIAVRQAKNYVKVRFHDTGKGIDKKSLDRVFEPFFTTKGAIGGNEAITGTGLGLSVSYGIVRRHGGTIKVKSEKEKGTTFTVSLPVKGAIPISG